MTLLCFLSWDFTVVLPELDEDLDEVFSFGLYEVCDLDLLQSLEWVDNLYVRIISCVVCHGDSDKCWSDSIWKCFCGDVCDVIWNNFYVNYCSCDFNICGSVTVMLTCYVCACPGGVERLIWCGALCETAASCGMQVCLMVVFYPDSLLLCDHIHCIWNRIHSGNDMQCGLILGTGSIAISLIGHYIDCRGG